MKTEKNNGAKRGHPFLQVKEQNVNELKKTLRDVAEWHAQEQIDYFKQLFKELAET